MVETFAYRDVCLIPLQLREILVESLEKSLPELLRIRSTTRLLQIRTFRQRRELLPHFRPVLEISMVQEVLVTPHLLLRGALECAKYIQQRYMISFGRSEAVKSTN